MSQPPPLDPYRIPQAPPPPATPMVPPGLMFLRQGKILLVRDGAELPPYCVRTNLPLQEGTGRHRKSLSWTPQWIPLVLLLSLLLGPVFGILTLFILLGLAILAFVSRKKLRLGYSVSRQGAKQLNRPRALAGAGVIAGFGVIAVVIWQGMTHGAAPILALCGGMLTIVSLALLTQIAPIRIAGWRQGWFRVKGCGPDFLDRIERGG